MQDVEENAFQLRGQKASNVAFLKLKYHIGGSNDSNISMFLGNSRPVFDVISASPYQSKTALVKGGFFKLVC